MLNALTILAIAIAIAGGLFYLSRLPKDYEVRRSLTMRADRQAVFDRVRDFRTWGDWSPWLLHEPDAKRDFSAAEDQPGGSYAWDGRYIGAGRLTHVRFAAPGRIEQRLEIQRPFKSELRPRYPEIALAIRSTAIRSGQSERNGAGGSLLRGGCGGRQRPDVTLAHRLGR